MPQKFVDTFNNYYAGATERCLGCPCWWLPACWGWAPGLRSTGRSTGQRISSQWTPSITRSASVFCIHYIVGNIFNPKYFPDHCCQAKLQKGKVSEYIRPFTLLQYITGPLQKALCNKVWIWPQPGNIPRLSTISKNISTVISLTPAPGEHQGQIPKAGSRPLPRQAPAQQDAQGRELQLQVSVDSVDSVYSVDTYIYSIQRPPQVRDC